MNDSGVFGVDEGIALNIANIYGTIGITNYGFVDREKTGVTKNWMKPKTAHPIRLLMILSVRLPVRSQRRSPTGTTNANRVIFDHNPAF